MRAFFVFAFSVLIVALSIFVIASALGGKATEVGMSSSSDFDKDISIFRGEFEIANRWLSDCWDWRVVPHKSILSIDLYNGDSAVLDFDYMNVSGIYIRPYAGIVLPGLSPSSASKRVMNDLRFSTYGKNLARGIDLSLWGLQGNEVKCLTFTTDVTFLPGARLPELLLNPFYSGVRSASLPPNVGSVDIWQLSTINDSESRSFAKMAKVSLYCSKEGKLIREIVNLGDGEGNFFAGHVFDFIYSSNLNRNGDKYPVKIMLKIWPYEQGRSAILDNGLQNGPGSYGVSFCYGTKAAANAIGTFFVDEVVVKDDPQEKYFDPTIGGHVEKSECPRRIKIEASPDEETRAENDTPLDLLSILQQIY
ncbi:MAG: hypothetical protein HRF49_10485 [bacterium]|jgi:hypothetical protein